MFDIILPVGIVCLPFLNPLSVQLRELFSTSTREPAGSQACETKSRPLVLFM
jgi:hypothetical protein